jgi:hypothetical protein
MWNLAEETSQIGIIQVSRKGERAALCSGDLGTRDHLAQSLDELLDFEHVISQVAVESPLMAGAGSLNEHIGYVGCVLDCHRTGEVDVKIPTRHGSQDSLGKARSKALISTDAIYDVGSQTHASQLPVLPIDLGTAFVGQFVAAIEGTGIGTSIVWNGRLDVLLWGSHHSDRASIGETLDPIRKTMCCLEHVDGADHVHLGSQRRVSLTEGNLQAGEMNDSGYSLLLNDVDQGSEVGNIQRPPGGGLQMGQVK